MTEIRQRPPMWNTSVIGSDQRRAVAIERESEVIGGRHDKSDRGSGQTHHFGLLVPSPPYSGEKV